MDGTARSLGRAVRRRLCSRDLPASTFAGSRCATDWVLVSYQASIRQRSRSKPRASCNSRPLSSLLFVYLPPSRHLPERPLWKLDLPPAPSRRLACSVNNSPRTRTVLRTAARAASPAAHLANCPSIASQLFQTANWYEDHPSRLVDRFTFPRLDTNYLWR